MAPPLLPLQVLFCRTGMGLTGTRSSFSPPARLVGEFNFPCQFSLSGNLYFVLYALVKKAKYFYTQDIINTHSSGYTYFYNEFRCYSRCLAACSQPAVGLTSFCCDSPCTHAAPSTVRQFLHRPLILRITSDGVNLVHLAHQNTYELSKFYCNCRSYSSFLP